MTQSEKWQKRAQIKRAICDHDGDLRNVSDAKINPMAGLPVDAVWSKEVMGAK